MNIFAVSLSPYLCAHALDDVRLVKMTLETAQILSMAARRGTLPALVPDQLYQPTHEHHPVVEWACSTRDRALWTRQLLLYLCLEYTHRFGKEHASQIILDAVGGHGDHTWRVPQESELARCDGHPEVSACEGYRRCLVGKWRADVESDRLPTWRRRGPPLWLEEVLWLPTS